MKKRTVAALTLALLSLGSIVGVYAYLNYISLTGVVSIAGFDVLAYDPSTYDNYGGLVDQTSLVSYLDMPDCIALTVPDRSDGGAYGCTGVTVSIIELPEGVTCSLVMHLGSWRNIDEVGTLFLWEQGIYALDELIAIDSGDIDYGAWDQCWIGTPSPPEVPAGVNTILIEFVVDTSLYEGAWGDFPFDVTMEFTDA